jgi:hypothetical protein
MLGAKGPLHAEHGRIVPLERWGVHVMSIGFLRGGGRRMAEALAAPFFALAARVEAALAAAPAVPREAA